ncbi:DUF2461 domain-containing protein, partial [Thermodesulfobacteriota bacterium]
ATFNGFSIETIRFFEKLKDNNTKEWFDAHREEYESFVKIPSVQFVVDMGEKLRHLTSEIKAIPKVNKSLFRINRDTRFSRDKRPYKTNLGIWFWEGERKRMECSGFYFHIGDGKLMLGVGIHTFSRELLNLYREAVVDKDLSPKLRKTVNKVLKEGYVIGGKHYKRTPRGYDAGHKQAEFLLHNGLFAMIENDIPDALFSPQVIDHAFLHYKKMFPLHEWLIKVVGQ